MIDVKGARDVRAEKRSEWLESRLEQQEADLAYVAMMADIELEGAADELVQQD